MADVGAWRRHPARPVADGPHPGHGSAAAPARGRPSLRRTPVVWLMVIAAGAAIILLSAGIDPGLVG